MIASATSLTTHHFNQNINHFATSKLEHFVQHNALATHTHAVVVIRWLKSNLYRSYDPVFTVACNELCEILHENRLRDDLFFSIDSNSVGLVLWRPTANHLHIALRDLIQEVSYAKTESTNGKMRLIRQVLSLQIGWAVSNHNFYGVDVLHKAQRRSFSYENVM